MSSLMAALYQGLQIDSFHPRDCGTAHIIVCFCSDDAFTAESIQGSFRLDDAQTSFWKQHASVSRKPEPP
jgi:hypothetical protein